MTSVTRQVVSVTTGMILLAGSYILHVRLDHLHDSTPKLQRFMYLPQGEALKIVSLGYEELVADFLWLHTIQVMGEKKVPEEAGRWIYRALDIVTTLDPKFVRAYVAGGIALCTLVVLPHESNALLDKGMKNNPQVWELPFLLGFNYYFDLGDDAKAAEYIAQASRIPGAPEFLVRLAARMYVSGKAAQNAVDFLGQVYEHASDENVKKALEPRLKEAIVERDLQLLEEAISRYLERSGHPPERLEDLVGPGLLRELPREPFGGRYLYDPQTRAVRSSEVERRITIQGKRRSV